MNMAGIVKFLHMIKSSLVFVLVESGCLAALFFYASNAPIIS